MASDDGKMQCPRCGEDVYPNDQYCLSCGSRLDQGELVGKEASASEEEDVPRPVTSETSGGEQPMPATAFPSEGDEADRAGPPPGPEAPSAATAEVNYDTGPGQWRPGSVTGGRGFFDSLSRGWAFLKESVAMAFRDRDLFIPSLLAVLANIVLLGGLAALLYFTGNIDAVFGDESEKLTIAGYVILFVVGFASYVINYFFTGMTVHLVDVHLRGEDAKLNTAFADAVKNFGGIAGLAAASLVVGMITSAIRGKGRGSGLRRAAANTVEQGWTAITYLLLPIMILEDSPLMQSADRARKLHGHNVIQIVVGELGLMLASRLLSGVVTFLGVGFAVGSYFLAPVLLPVGIAAAVLLLVVSMAFAGYVRTAFYTCLYLWAVAMETVGEEAPAPAPLQPAVSAGW